MKRLALIFSLLSPFCLSNWAQDTATIVGTVMDSSGAVIAAAQVKVANRDKGFTRVLESNAAGEYTAAKIPIGNYVGEAGSPGFKKLVRSGIALAVGQTLRVDFELTLGAVAQEVTITGNVPRRTILIHNPQTR